MFDADGNGYIDVEELSTIMAKLGQSLDQKQLKESLRKKFFASHIFTSGDDHVC